MINIAIVLSAFLLSTSVFAATINIEPCSGSGCVTLIDAINMSSPGDVIEMAAGNYTISPMINVNKALTIHSSGNAVISAIQGFNIGAPNVRLSGLTIRDSTGYGVGIYPGAQNTVLENNTITNNTNGIWLGAGNTTIINNTISNNNLGDSSGGNGIYSFDSIEGPVSNILIKGNSFQGHNRNDIYINNPNNIENLQISDNTFSRSERGIQIANTTNVQITDNTFSDMQSTLGGSYSVAIYIWAENTNVVVTGNRLTNGQKYGVYIWQSRGVPNKDIKINRNHITGFADSGMFMSNGSVSDGFDATCNWWGDASGPQNDTFNANGTGDKAGGQITSEQVNPWLMTSNLKGKCGGQPDPDPTPSYGFGGIWENRATKSCIRISEDETKAESFRKCGPFNCNTQKGTFTTYANASGEGGYGIINYDNTRKSDQKLVLLSETRMSVSNNEQESDRTLIYRKVDRCHWHPKWKWPFPKPPKPQPPTPPTPH